MKLRLVKNPNWTWRNDLKYYLIVPFEIIRMIPAILKGEPRKLNDMHWKDYINLARAFADAKTGRMYKCVWDKKR